MKKSNILAIAALFLTAAIWGLSYSAQAEAMKNIAPLSFVSLRYFLGVLVLLPLILFKNIIIQQKIIQSDMQYAIFIVPWFHWSF